MSLVTSKNQVGEVWRMWRMHGIYRPKSSNVVWVKFAARHVAVSDLFLTIGPLSYRRCSRRGVAGNGWSFRCEEPEQYTTTPVTKHENRRVQNFKHSSNSTIWRTLKNCVVIHAWTSSNEDNFQLFRDLFDQFPTCSVIQEFLFKVGKPIVNSAICNRIDPVVILNRLGCFCEFKRKDFENIDFYRFGIPPLITKT